MSPSRPHARATTRTMTLASVGLVALATLVGCTPGPLDEEGEVSASVAVIDEFFAHLEAGETAEAAALTTIDFPAEVLDEDFYTASGVTPSKAKVVSTSGDDAYAVKATVEYVLDDPDDPVTATFTITNNGDGERTVGWEQDGGYPLILIGAPGRIVVNDELEFSPSTEAHGLVLLPGLYDVAYVDETGTTHLDDDGSTEFALPMPVTGDREVPNLPSGVSATSGNISVSISVPPETIDAVEAQIDELTTACVAEGMTGPSCPPELREYGAPPTDPSSVEWFRSPGYGLEIAEGRVTYSMGFTVNADGEVFPETVVYVGDVTQNDDGTIVYTRR